MTDIPKKLSENARTVLTLATTPRGFLKVVDEKALAFADYRGNRQYHQHRQPRGRSSGLPVPHGLPSQGAAQSLRPRRSGSPRGR